MSRRQEPFIDDFEAQISLAENVWNSDITGKGRIAFVLLDNVIEFMSKAFLKVTRNLVGRRRNPKITPDQWHKISRHFNKLMEAMRLHSPLQPSTIDSIDRNHGIRNDLYHTSSPTEVRTPLFGSALENAIVVLESLYGAQHKSMFIDVDVTLHGKPDLSDITHVVGDDSIRFDNPRNWTNLSQCVRVVIHGYASKLGKNPTFPEIMHSLQISHVTPMEHDLQQCLRNLSKTNQISKTIDDTYSLTSPGKKIMMDRR